MARSSRLVARVVLVPGGASAAEARRRVADVLLHAATAGAEAPAPAEPTLPQDPTSNASPPPGAGATGTQVI